MVLGGSVMGKPKDPKLWVSKAEPEQRGSFCDVDSQHHYQNVNELGALETIESASSAGTQPVVVDEVELGNRYNLLRTEDDDQGLSVPEKYGPGR